MLDGQSGMSTLELELGREHVAGRRFRPAGTDLGDHGLGGVETGFARARARRAGRAVRSFRCDRRCLESRVRASSIILERISLDLSTHHDQGRLVGRALEETPRGSGRHRRVCRPWPQERLRARRARRSSGTRRGRLSDECGLRASCLVLQGSGSRAARRWGFPCPGVPAHRCGRWPGPDSPSCTSICASRTRTVALDSGPAASDFSNSAAAFRGSPGSGVPGIPRHAADEARRSARAARPAADLLEKRADDRLGLFGITGLENRPRRPELVAGHRGCRAAGRFAETGGRGSARPREHEGNSVPRLRLADFGQLRGRKLQMIECARAQGGLGFLSCAGLPAVLHPDLRVPHRTGRARSSPRKGAPAPGNSGPGTRAAP